ncbi:MULTISPECIES: hypothetical protein [Ralstonia solanacearum species complex]|nr:hypothetical protein [Ralstonia solanacearum]ALF90229.1 hypothetical protein RSUY_39220 [Ralstonia solanacearum]ATI29709.1 hypothetical protein CCY86_19655 [Ralstonia solanacearum]KEI30968.1 hypothetical protein CQ06_02115 [Ralstonia solanacearum]KFX77409.1 transmembrane protein [Ralstonia solanacearum]KFX82348.1 transmembrane protein [Ralstonia solanacearum]
MSAPSRLAHPLRDSAFRLTRRRRWTVYGVFGVLLLTGLAWLIQHFTDDGSEGGMAVLAWSMKLHGAAAMASLYLFGMLWGPHIRNAWVRRRNRAAGAVFGGLAALLVATGYALYYVNGKLPRQCAEVLHWGAGLAVCVALWVHIVVGRRRRKAGAAFQM